MPKLIPIAERNPLNRCWFCGTNKSVKYMGTIPNACPTASIRYHKIMMCNKCALLHEKHLVEYWLDEKEIK